MSGETEMRKARDFRDGDLVDLAGDQYAGKGESVQLVGPFEYAVVEDPPEHETPGCVVLHTTQGSFGMPPEHELPYLGRYRR